MLMIAAGWRSRTREAVETRMSGCREESSRNESGLHDEPKQTKEMWEEMENKLEVAVQISLAACHTG
jgi:hypothetical protein